MKLSRIKLFVSSILAVILSAPALAASDAHSALPGTLNYVEGQANIGSNTLNAGSLGSAMLEPGQTLNTGNGKAEILLTPGVFLRVDGDSAVKMISPSITNTRIQLEQGRAMLEVAELHDQNHLFVREDGFDTQLVKKGLYEFDADKQQILVFDGKAHVQDGDRIVSVKAGKKVDLNDTGTLKAHSFDKEDYKQSDLYQWSSLRSNYLAEANVDAARVYVADGYYGPGWIGSGWYWAPGFGGYTFIPADGILYSPFGCGFYSPLVVYRAPLHYGFNRWGNGNRGLLSGSRGAPAAPPRTSVAGTRPAFHSSPAYHGGSSPHVSGFSHSGSGGGGHSMSNHR